MNSETQCCRAIAHILLVVETGIPKLTCPVDPSDSLDTDGVIDLLHQWAGLIAVEEPDGPLTDINVGPKAHEALLAVELGCVRGNAIPEATVDRGLGGVEHGDRLAAGLVQIGKLLAHHRREDPSTPVCRGDADPRDACNRLHSTRNRHGPRVDCHTCDWRIAIERCDCALEFDGRSFVLEVRIAPVLAVGVGDHVGPRLELVGAYGTEWIWISHIDCCHFPCVNFPMKLVDFCTAHLS